ncbi:hypothetical protein GCM10009608_04790 [Pseudonocardia alaniniphila]
MRPVRGPPDQDGVAERLRRGDHQQLTGVRRQRRELAAEALLDPLRQWHRRGQPEPAGQLGGCQPARKLQQGQRIAAGLSNDPVEHPLVHRTGQRRAQQRPRVLVGQTAHHQLLQTRGLLLVRFLLFAGLARREDHRHGLSSQPPCGEHQGLRGGTVEPLNIIHHTDERLLPRHLRKQPEHSEADQQAARWVAVAQPERGGQRLPLRTREMGQLIQHRRAELVQPGERQLHL